MCVRFVFFVTNQDGTVKFLCFFSVVGYVSMVRMDRPVGTPAVNKKFSIIARYTRKKDDGKREHWDGDFVQKR
jgi:membrane-associated protease RseP (regulator of RpoE activity)